jgi:hypothetical protein
VETTGATAATFGAAVSVQSLTVDAGDTSGLIGLNGGAVTTTAGQTYDAAVTLGQNTLLKDTGAGAITFGASATLTGAAETLDVETTGATAATFGAPVSVRSLTVEASDTAGLIGLNGGAVTTTAGQTYDATVNLGQNTVLKDTGTGSITFGPAATISGATETLDVETTGATAANFGGAVNLQSLMVDVSDPAGTIDLNGGTVTTSAGQIYGGTIDLSASPTILTGTTLSLQAVNLGVDNLTIDDSVSATINAAVTGSGTLTFSGSGIISLQSVTAGSIIFNNNVTLNGTYDTSADNGNFAANGTVTLAGGTTVKTGTGNATFVGAVNGDQALTINSQGATTFDSPVGSGIALASLTTDVGGTSSSVGVQTTGATTFNNATTLNGVYGDSGFTTANTTTLAGPTTINAGAGGATFQGNVDGAFALAVNSTGLTLFGSPVGSEAPLASLTVDATDRTSLIDLNGGTVTTVGAQTYDGAVNLTAATTLVSTGSGSITLGSTVNGAEVLDVETKGTTTFSAPVGGSAPLNGLAVDETLNGGSIDLNGGAVTTTAGQTYDAAVTLGQNTMLKDIGAGAITFGSSASVTGAAETLDVETTGATAATFGAAVSVQSLTVEASDTSGLIGLNGGAVTTTGGQAYDAAVTLGQNTVLKDTGTGTIAFGPSATVNGAEALDVETTGATAATFGAAVSVQSLLVDASDAAGLIGLNGGAVTTAAGQTYDAAVTLGQNTVLKDTGTGPITFGTSGTISGGAEMLIVATTGATATTFGAAVATRRLEVDQTDTAGLIDINGGTVTTTAGQSYYGAITLGQNTALEDSGAGAIAFGPNATISGAAESLDVETTGVTAATFGAAVATRSLTVDAIDAQGLINLHGGSVTTTAGQTYDGAVTLGLNTVLKDTGAGAIAFGPSATINGPSETLDVETTGATSATFGAAVATKSLTVDAGDTSGLIGLNGGTVTTSAGQTYDAAVTLGQNTVLKDAGNGAITFGPNSTISGAAESLDVETSGATAATFGAAVAIKSLTVDASDSPGMIKLNGGTVTTTAGQT